MIKIQTILLGLPVQEADTITIRPIIDSTTALECNTYYEILSESKVLLNGNYPINEEEYKAWGNDNSFIENIVLKGLGLERL
jgi:hypothetical protein